MVTKTHAKADLYGYKTKGDIILEILRDAILNGEIPPGAHLRQDQVAKQFDMSATPVREAFRHLQREGLLLYHPHRGMRVSESSPESIDEIYSLRIVIEPLIAGRTCEWINNIDLDHLYTLEDQMKALASRGDAKSIAQVNHDFHRLIHIVSGSRLLHEWISRLWMLSPVDTFWAVPNRVRLSSREHDEILAAFRHRKKEAAEEAMRKHVLSAWKNVKKAVHKAAAASHFTALQAASTKDVTSELRARANAGQAIHRMAQSASGADIPKRRSQMAAVSSTKKRVPTIAPESLD
jgi:DNA-binding GntR family transcriptional regulator